MLLTSGDPIRGRTVQLMPSTFSNALRTRFSPRLRGAYGYKVNEAMMLQNHPGQEVVA